MDRYTTGAVFSACEIARAFRQQRLYAEHEDVAVEGRKSVTVDDLLESSWGKTTICWPWKEKGHFKAPEAHSGIKATITAAHDQNDSCLLVSLSPRAVEETLINGRSSSAGLQTACKESAAL